MHCLYRVNRLRFDTGVQNISRFAELVILQPQHPNNGQKIVG